MLKSKVKLNTIFYTSKTPIYIDWTLCLVHGWMQYNFYFRNHVPVHKSPSFRWWVITMANKKIQMKKKWLFHFDITDFTHLCVLRGLGSDWNDMKVAFALQQSGLKYIFLYYLLDFIKLSLKQRHASFFGGGWTGTRSSFGKCAGTRNAFLTKERKRERVLFFLFFRDVRIPSF